MGSIRLSLRDGLVLLRLTKKQCWIVTPCPYPQLRLAFGPSPSPSPMSIKILRNASALVLRSNFMIKSVLIILLTSTIRGLHKVSLSAHTIVNCDVPRMLTSSQPHIFFHFIPLAPRQKRQGTFIVENT